MYHSCYFSFMYQGYVFFYFQARLGGNNVVWFSKAGQEILQNLLFKGSKELTKINLSIVKISLDNYAREKQNNKHCLLRKKVTFNCKTCLYALKTRIFQIPIFFSPLRVNQE